MFKKKIKCICGAKVSKDMNFCPKCGRRIKEVEELEKERREQFNSIEKQIEEAFNMPFFVRFPFRQLVKQLEKQIDAEMRNLDKELNKEKRDKDTPIISGLSISISSDGNEPIIKINHIGPGKGNLVTPELKAEETAEKLTKQNMNIQNISAAKAAKLAKMPKKEPETIVRRLSDRIIYEISVPGVKNIKDVIINKLQNSIEIKAFAKDKVYFKLLPVSLPIKKYKIEDEKLVLELVP